MSAVDSLSIESNRAQRGALCTDNRRGEFRPVPLKPIKTRKVIYSSNLSTILRVSHIFSNFKEKWDFRIDFPTTVKGTQRWRWMSKQQWLKVDDPPFWVSNLLHSASTHIMNTMIHDDSKQPISNTFFVSTHTKIVNKYTWLLFLCFVMASFSGWREGHSSILRFMGLIWIEKGGWSGRSWNNIWAMNDQGMSDDTLETPGSN